jgi:hypothetical protein
MSVQNTRKDHESADETVGNDDLELFEESGAEPDEPTEEDGGELSNSRLDMRQRIEEKLEERRLTRELNEYEFFDIDDSDRLH